MNLKTFSAEARAWLSRAIGLHSCDLDIVRMKGSTSSSVFRVQCAPHADSQRYVLRVLDNRAWLAEEPDLAAHEAAALDEAHKAALRAPRLVAYDDGECFGTPVVLMTFVEGSVELQPTDFQGWLNGLARELAAIHRHTADGFAWRFRSWVNPSALAPPAWTTIPHTWERAIDVWRNGAPNFQPVFVHRDYHPTNVLWQAGTVSGVVDWINACRGPAGVDVAHCRSNLALMFGTDAADEFLKSYGNVADGFAYRPYWDLDSVLDVWLPEPKFYPPWQDFGLGMITPPELQRRADAFLERVMRRI